MRKRHQDGGGAEHPGGLLPSSVSAALAAAVPATANPARRGRPSGAPDGGIVGAGGGGRRRRRGRATIRVGSAAVRRLRLNRRGAERRPTPPPRRVPCLPAPPRPPRGRLAPEPRPRSGRVDRRARLPSTAGGAGRGRPRPARLRLPAPPRPPARHGRRPRPQPRSGSGRPPSPAPPRPPARAGLPLEAAAAIRAGSAAVAARLEPGGAGRRRSTAGWDPCRRRRRLNRGGSRCGAGAGVGAGHRPGSRYPFSPRPGVRPRGHRARRLRLRSAERRRPAGAAPAVRAGGAGARRAAPPPAAGRSRLPVPRLPVGPPPAAATRSAAAAEADWRSARVGSTGASLATRAFLIAHGATDSVTAGHLAG